MISIFYLLIIITLKISTGTSHTINENPEALSEDFADLQVDVLDDYISEKYLSAFLKAGASRDIWLHQYAPDDGHKRLLEALANLYSKRLNITLNPAENILVTVGATEALYSAFTSLTYPGQEWIMMEPFWSKLQTIVRIAGGVPRFTSLNLKNNSKTLNGNDYKLNKTEMESLVNENTTGILLNNPHNPTGKVYTLEELEFIAYLADKYDLIVVSDEVYEWTVYDSYKHINFASLPGMFNRTVTIGSASKSFDLSGWRIGWAYGPEHLMSHMKGYHSNIVSSAPNPQQDAVAFALEEEYQNLGKENSFFNTNLFKLKLKRNFLVRILKNVGIQAVVPNGGHCLVVMMSIFKNNPAKNKDTFDKIIGVRGHSLVHFYSEKSRDIGMNTTRYCFQKNYKTLLRAEKKLIRAKLLRLI